MSPSVTPETLRLLGGFDTCTLANAIESFGVRMRNEGYGDSTLAWRTPGMAPMVGVAVTLRVRSADPSMKAGFYLDQPDWWERLEVGPSELPRVLVIEDTDSHPGRGALVGPVHACVLGALGCAGVVTNGAVRGLQKFDEIGLRAFSGSVSPSHAYSHVIAVGVPVKVGGLQIAPGEILHGDRHGFLSVPAGVAPRLPEAAARLLKREERLCRYCSSAGFSPQALRRLIEGEAGPG